MKNKNKNKPFEKSHQENSNKLGIDYSSLGELTPEDLKNSKTAGMVLHYLSSLEQDNSELKTTNETLKTYGNAYNIKKNTARTGSALSLLAMVAIGFGINLLTENIRDRGGIILVILGVCVELYAIYLSNKSE